MHGVGRDHVVDGGGVVRLAGAGAIAVVRVDVWLCSCVVVWCWVSVAPGIYIAPNEGVFNRKTRWETRDHVRLD